MTWHTPGEGEGGGPAGAPPPAPPASSAPPPPPPPPPPPAYGAAAPEYQYAQPAPGYGAPGPRYTGWWRRVGAFLIDFVIIAIASSLVQAAIGGQRVLEQTDGNGWRLQFGVRGTLGSLAGLLILLAYSTFLEGGPKGQTVGKMATGIRVADADAGTPIGYPRALGRRLLAVVMAWVLFLPWVISVLWPLWDARKQTLHDKAVNAVVVTTT